MHDAANQRERSPIPEAPPAAERARPMLSVVAPAFNQAATIYANIAEIAARLETLGVGHELIVVSDGSLDRTRDELDRHSVRGVRVLAYDRNLGKGYALRTGSAAARGDYVAWIDSDLDLDPAGLARFMDLMVEHDLDAVVGSKRHPESQVAYPARRRLYSWGYQQLVRALFRLDVRDTQVGMKLFRREVLDEVLPVVLVKRYAFDLEILAVARAFGFDRIAEAPIRLDYQFGSSGVNWRAIAQALWDTAAVFYRLRLLRFYERRRVLARRVAATRPQRPPSVTAVLVPLEIDAATQAAVERVRRVLPEGGRILVAAPGAPEGSPPLVGAEVVASGTGSRSERIARVLGRVGTDVVAFVDQEARPSDGWATSALALFGDPTVGAVVGPTVALLDGDDRRDAAGILHESRLGFGGARVRHHVGRLREVGDFPASNLFVRTAALQRALEEGHALDDDLCAVMRRRHGQVVLCSPDVVVASRPTPLFRPHLRMLHRLGRDRGRRVGTARPLRPRHLAPTALVLALAAAPRPCAPAAPRGRRGPRSSARTAPRWPCSGC
ncbi:glycosyltransferase family 2 protein [Miltoncostaea marina]|uniref:glycosyltransferase family 2 protein n=1 Tax=Miltoncostaea marina TaxID=2843215 RepID=UPI001C3C8DF1|nr:glycosyltransferase [Miltoncostaea marina]